MNIDLSGSVDIEMYNKVCEALKLLKSSEIIHITINSEGGAFSEAKAIYSRLTTIPNKVRTITYANCHSAAVTIFLAGQTRLATEHSEFLLHDESGEIEGTARQMLQHANLLEREDRLYNQLLFEHTKTPVKIWQRLSEKETYLSLNDAIKYKLVTGILPRKNIG